MMLPFDFHCPTRIVFGPGKIDELGRSRWRLAMKRALVVSDPGIVAAGHTPRGIESLEAVGIDVALFDGVAENPTTEHVEAGLRRPREFRPDLIVGLGGGSSMDCAKGINFLYSCGGRMQDYWGEGKATGPMLPMIAVPTTAGTGSETQSYALISDAETHVKMACGDKRAAFRVAILDPELTVTQPPRVTALTGIDALSHAIETYVTKRRNAISLAFSREAWRHLAPNFARVLDEPQNLAARAEMQLGACLAGLAIENSMLGAAHALANPLTATLRHCPRRGGRADAAARDPPQWPARRRLVSRTGAIAAASRQRAVDRRCRRDALAEFVADVSRAGRPGWYTDRVRRVARRNCRSWPPPPPSNGPASSIPSNSPNDDSSGSMKRHFKLRDASMSLAAADCVAAVDRCVAAAADDWPVVRGDMLGTGVAEIALPDELEVLWTYQAADDAGFDATAVVADGIVYVGDNAGTFHAVRLADGTAVWTKAVRRQRLRRRRGHRQRPTVCRRPERRRPLPRHRRRQRTLVRPSSTAKSYAGPTPHGDDVLVTSEPARWLVSTRPTAKSAGAFHIDAPLRCSPTISAGRVMLAGCDSLLHVIDVADGKETAHGRHRRPDRLHCRHARRARVLRHRRRHVLSPSTCRRTATSSRRRLDVSRSTARPADPLRRRRHRQTSSSTARKARRSTASIRPAAK